MPGSDCFTWQDDTLLLSVYIQPRASRDEIVGLHDNALKIRITAPPVDGKANAHLGKFLARSFGVKQNQVELLSGATGRHKRFAIHQPAKLPPLLTD
ncbi:MAG: DUF167 family protein [Gammaproteobacteria bacterium]|nr:DUF167 family protein [Gammaproteobacteria bacterium]MDH5650417.1 DUF167 family protein [Gammaproteobacteria bacterium]